ncbi:MAG: thiamine ABC transporter substrate-binding protein [Treponema sp.]|nr:thiamine ABC transporter substrate-binding protein [Treponema sp.]
MKKSSVSLLISFIFILVCSCFFSACKKTDVRTNELVIYSYDSFIGEWGPGPELARLFEEKTGIKVIYADCGDGVQILSKALFEKKDPYADVLIGLDNNLSKQALSSGILYAYKPANIDEVIDNALIDELNNPDAPSKRTAANNYYLIPYDYSKFAMIYNTQSKVPAPTCLEDLTKSIYEKKIILMDPKTSTPGLGFDVWVKTVYGDKYDDYMKRLQPSILTMAPGWSVGYGMFTNGEAPLVISYTTSPAYHIEYGEGDQFVALKFTDGHVQQIEGAAIVKGAKNLSGAKAFMDFFISEEAQSVIPLTQWMFPANKKVVLPESYKVAF